MGLREREGSEKAPVSNVNGNNPNFRINQIWIQISGLPPVSCVTLGKSFTLPVGTSVSSSVIWGQ